MKGIKTKRVGNITISCMDAEARNLLDLAVQKWRKANGESEYLKDYDPYSAFYWLFRYSGLVEPSKQALNELSKIV
jgi:hypothetical protein